MCLINADTDPIEQTILTERQVRILRLRERGWTQQEIADQLGTSTSNISAIEKAARTNIEKARQTLDLVDVLQAPIRLQIEEGVSFEELVSAICQKADEVDIELAYARPELYGHLYTDLHEQFDNNRLMIDIEIGITPNGDVTVFEQIG